MPVFRADLHIHSCLSPCGDLSASPKAIAAAARKAGMDLVALADHNSALNTPAFEAACRNEGISAVFGMEMTTREEIHVLTLFPTSRQALKAGEEAYERLKSVSFVPKNFGDQVWVNENEEIEGRLEKLLIIGTTDISIDDAGPWTKDQGGLFIPAHIDRPAFGAIGVLGFLPPGSYDGVECRELIDRNLTDPWTVTAASDAHRPEDIGRRYVEFEGGSADFDSLRRALTEGNVKPFFL